MRPYPKELRDRVLAACEAGEATKQVADRFDVGRSWVRRLKQRLRETGDASPRPHGGGRPRQIDPEKLASLVRRKPDALLTELRDGLGLKCSPSAICMALKKLGITLKKS